jgi:hypothetical protein
MQVIDEPACVDLIPLAFPSLRSLYLREAQLVDGILFDAFGLRAGCMLRSLQLYHCSIDTDAIERTAHSLARLPHLQALVLVGPGVSVSIAAQLTGLTSLILSSGAGTDADQMLLVAGQNRGLVELELGTSSARPPLQVIHLLTSVSNHTSLAKLDISYLQVDGQALDILLAQCTSITDLTLGPTTLDSSRADGQCSWRRLSLLGSFDSTLFQLAYLPLKSVQRLEERWGALSGTLFLPPSAAVPAAQLPNLLHQAATNLATCPAWISALPSNLRLEGPHQGLSAHQRVQLLKSLAPLGGPHVTEMDIFLWDELHLGYDEVQALAGRIGGSLTTLRLRSCTLPGTFWKALTLHLPQLLYLGLFWGVTTSANDIAVYLTMRSCSPTQHMRLEVSRGVLDAESRLQLKEHVSSCQLQGITLLFGDASDDDDGVEEEQQEEEEGQEEEEEEGEEGEGEGQEGNNN